MTKTKRDIIINGNKSEIEADASARLIDVIREVVQLKGTKEGCGEGECGACSILLNENVVNSCLILFGQIQDGDIILTVEGLGRADHLTPLQECFVHEGGAQCGICTPGMLIAAHALLSRNRSPTRHEIAEAISGNLCRCTGYTKIIDAIENAAALIRGDS